jgi:hypothetical protein
MGGFVFLCWGKIRCLERGDLISTQIEVRTNFHFVFATRNLSGFKNLIGLALGKLNFVLFSYPAPMRPPLWLPANNQQQTTKNVPTRTRIRTNRSSASGKQQPARPEPVGIERVAAEFRTNCA